jgi:hypothetical protein
VESRKRIMITARMVLTMVETCFIGTPCKAKYYPALQDIPSGSQVRVTMWAVGRQDSLSLWERVRVRAVRATRT